MKSQFQSAQNRWLDLYVSRRTGAVLRLISELGLETRSLAGRRAAALALYLRDELGADLQSYDWIRIQEDLEGSD